MKSLHVKYDEKNGAIERIGDASPEVWEEVCDRFDNDVSRIKTVTDQKGYNTLFVCHDEENRPEYYLVEVDDTLSKLRGRTFRRKLGME